MNKLLLVFIAATAATWTTPVAADFGDYRSHEQQGQSLLVTTDVGQLRITVIDEAGFLFIRERDPLFSDRFESAQP